MNKNIIEDLQNISNDFKDNVIDFAAKLIKTSSLSGKEKDLSNLLIEEMNKLGYDECFKDAAGNVIGIVNGTDEGPVIMYNSHMDHVGAGDIENWQGYNPFGGEIDECEIHDQDKKCQEKVSCIHGRGASDVKGGEAAQVYAGAVLLKLRQKDYKFKGKFVFTGVVLEEPAQMMGMTHLVDKTFPEKGIKYDAVVSSEASSLKLYLGHRGRVEMLATVYGRTSHGSAPWLGINAIYKAVPLIERIKGKLSSEVVLNCDKELGKSTVSINIIECSPGAMSIVPDKCMLSIDRRLVPGETPEKGLKEIQAIIDELSAEDPEFKADVKIKETELQSYTGMKFKAPKVMVPWKIKKEHNFVKAAAEALESIGQTVKYGYWDFGTDASKTAGIGKKPTIGYSPMQEEYAHTPYDKVRTDFIVKAVAGNAAIFLNACKNDKKFFELL